MHLLRRLSKLDALRMGFGAMIALLIFSAAEAYRIQSSSGRHSAEIYHRFVQKGAALARIRRLIFLGSIYTRDLFLNTRPDRAKLFETQLARLDAESQKEFEELERLTGRDQSTAALRAHVEGLWSKLESVLRWADGASLARAFDFVQNEVVPRRNEAAEMLSAYAEANQSALAKSEEEFEGNRRASARRLLLTLSLSLALGLIVACFSLVHATNLERQSERRLREVTRARRDLQQLSARLLETQETARRHLSRELHDEIGQTMHALRIEISQAQSAWKAGEPVAEARLEQARALAERTVESVRNITLLLRPPMLDDLGLGPALQWQVEEFSRRCGIPCTLSEEGLTDTLPDSYKTCVYRVVQEALHNCEKHSGAANASVLARQTPGRMTVVIEDDGRGFPAGAGEHLGGLGILGMQERAAALEGTLELESTPGAGTKLTLSLPLPDPDNKQEVSREEFPA
jgi:signal transduction histidine kinase